MVVGGVIGGVFGGGNWQAGAMIGSMIMGALIPPPPQIVEGPRLSDLRIQNSGYSKPIPKFYGGVRSAGNITYGWPFREEKTEETQSAKGGPSVKNVNYKYYGTFATTICEGPVAGIRRVWADGVLIFDASPIPDDKAIRDAAAKELASGVHDAFITRLVKQAQPNSNVPTFVYDPTPNADGAVRVHPHIKVYLGTDTQMPDATLEAKLGAGKVPAHRGTVYAVIDDLPLDKFGNRLPNLEFEVITSARLTSVEVPVFTGPDGLKFTSLLSSSKAAADTRRGMAYFSTDYSQKVRALDLATGSTEGVVLQNPKGFQMNLGFGGAMCYDDETDCLYIGGVETSSNAACIAKVRASDLTIVAGQTMLTAPGYRVVQLARGPKGVLMGVALNRNNGYFAVVRVNLSDFTLNIGATYSYTFSSEAPQQVAYEIATDTFHVLCTVPSTGVRKCLAFKTDTSLGLVSDMALNFPRITCNPTTGWLYGLNKTNMACNSAATQSKLIPFEANEPMTLVPPAGHEFEGLLFEASGSAFYTNLKTLNGPFAGKVYRFKAGTGELLNIIDMPAADAHGLFDGVEYLDETMGVIYGKEGMAYGAQLREQPPTVGAIFDDLAAKVGLDPSLYDSSAAKTKVDQVQGYAITSRTAARTAFEGLSVLWAIDAVETQGILRLSKRAHATLAAAIPRSKQAVTSLDSDPYYTKGTRSKEEDLPAVVEFGYSDPGLGYRESLARAIRTTTASKETHAFNYPVVMPTLRAQAVAEMIMAIKWSGRQAYETQVGMEYAHIDAGDVVDLELEEGWQRILVSRTRLSPNGLIQLQGSGFDYGIYGGLNTLSVGPVVAGSIAVNVNPSWKVMDLPAMAQADDTPGFHVACWHSQPSSAGAAAVLAELPDASWENLGVATIGATVGLIDAVDLADDLAWLDGCDAVLRPAQSLTVILNSGDLYTATDDELATGANLCAVWNGTYWEVLQFKTATYVGAIYGHSKYTLTGLVRGRFGTWVGMNGLHLEPVAGGNLFEPTFVRLGKGITRITVPASYPLPNEATLKVVAVGNTVESADGIVVELSNTAQECLAVAHLTATAEGGGVQATWVRQARYGAEMRDKAEIALVEQAENYDVLFTGANGTTISRSVQQPAISLTPAERTSLGAGYMLTVWQVGTSMGQGKPAFFWA